MTEVSPDIGQSFYKLTPMELAWGWIPGRIEHKDEGDDGVRKHPLVALEEVLLPLLAKPPCWLEFSGGRDSSALLAFCVHLARREGIEAPVPYTRRFRGDRDADESEWQELVIRHLGVQEWERVVFGDDLDLIGPVSQEGLRRYGVLWPVGIHALGPTWDVVRDGTLINGFGGDTVFSPLRITPLYQLLKQPFQASRHQLRQATKALLPRALRRRFVERRILAILDFSWLRPRTRRTLVDKMLSDELAEPLSWDAAILAINNRRVLATTMGNVNMMASRAANVRIARPFLEFAFMRAWARYGGKLGFADRGDAMTALFGDYLPESILTRRSKAAFNRSVVNEHSLRFVQRWQGGGVDPELVDPEVLKDLWLGPLPPGRTLLLLQSAWLAEQATT